jgi:FixJ family two-component response regulator
VDQRGQVVAIIDDDESVRKALQRLLRSYQLNAETCATAEEFLANEDALRSACLIVDVRMPGMSGLALQKQLACQGRQIPIVFISGYKDDQARREAIEAGAVGFFEKPFDDRALLEAVTKALAKGKIESSSA